MRILRLVDRIQSHTVPGLYFMLPTNTLAPSKPRGMHDLLKKQTTDPQLPEN